MHLFKFFYPFLLGIDVQKSHLTIVKAKKIKHKLYIETWIQEPIEHLLGKDNKIFNWQNFTKILGAIVQKNKLTRLPVAFALPENLVRIYQMQMPKDASHQEIQAQIELQIQQNLPGLAETLATDFVMQSSANPLCHDILYVITHQEYVNNLMQALADVGIILKIVDVDLYAKERFHHWWNEKNGKEKFIFHHNVDANNFKNNLEILSIACGSVLQKVPAW